MDNRSLTVQTTSITLSGGNAGNPLNWQYIIDHASTTNGVDYVTDSDFPNIVVLLKNVSVGSGYWVENTNNAIFDNNRSLTFNSTCDRVEFCHGVTLTTSRSLIFRADTDTVYVIDGFTIFLTTPATTTEILISMNIADADSINSYIRGFSIIAPVNNDLGAPATFQYDLPDSTRYHVRLLNVTASPNTITSEGSISIEGNGTSSVIDGVPYVLSSAGGEDMTTVLRNLVFYVTSSLASVRIFAGTTRTNLIDPLIYNTVAQTEGTFSLLDSVGTIVEVQKRMSGTVYDQDGSGIPSCRLRFFNDTHNYVPEVTALTATSGGSFGALLRGVYEVTAGGTVTDRTTMTVRVRQFGFLPIEEEQRLIPTNNHFRLNFYLQTDELQTYSALEVSTDTQITFNHNTRIITKGTGESRSPRFLYSRYQFDLAQTSSLSTKNYIIGREKFYDFDTGSDTAYTFNINGDFSITEVADIGTVFRSNGDIVLANTAGCNVLLEYTRSSVVYSSMLIDVQQNGEGESVDNFSDLKFNLRYKRTTEDDEGEETISFSDIYNDSNPPNVVTGRSEFLMQFATVGSGEDTLNVTNRELNLTIMTPFSYLQEFDFNISEYKLTIQQVNLLLIPGFDGMSFADLRTSYNSLLNTGTWTWDVSTHNLTINNVGTISVHDLAVFFQYTLIRTAGIFNTLTEHPFRYADNVLSYEDLDIVVDGNSIISDNVRILRYHSLTGTNANNQNVSGSVRFRLVNPEISSFKISIVNTADNSVILDFTTVTGDIYTYNEPDEISCRVILYAEGFVPRTINFNTNSNVLIDVLLLEEVEIDYTTDIGRMDINATDTIVSVTRVGTGTNTIATINIQPTSGDDISLTKLESLTFFGLIKAHNDYLSILRDFDYDNPLEIKEDQIEDRINKFNLVYISTGQNAGAYVHLSINIISTSATFNALNTSDRKIYYESIREICDSDAIINSIQTNSGCASLEDLRAIFL